MKRETLSIPPHLNEKEVLSAIEKEVNRIAPSFAFGYCGVEDIKQEARILCLDSLEYYDQTRSLSNFLRVVLQTRLLNFQRDHFQRNDPPCKECHSTILNCKINTCAVAREEREKVCKRYSKWYARNATKRNIVKPVDIDNIADIAKASPVDLQSEIDELTGLLDEKLDFQSRLLLLKLRDGIPLDNEVKAKLYETVRNALGGRCTLKEES